MTQDIWTLSLAPLKFHTLMVIKVFLNTEDTRLKSSPKSAHSWKSPSWSFSVNYPPLNNWPILPKESNKITLSMLTSTPWCPHSPTMPIPWAFYVALSLDCPPYTHNKIQVLSGKLSTKTKKSETNKSTKSSVTSPQLPPTLTDTESEETSISPLKNWDTSKTFCTCLTSSIKKNSNHIQNLSEL